MTYLSTNSNSYSYNGVGSRIGASGVGGSKTFRRDGIGVTSPLLSDGTNAITPGISTRASSTTKYLHGGLKNSTAQSNSSQAISATKQFDAFGNQLASSGSWTGMFGYGGAYGYQTDDELKLLGHRYYDSSIGRFLTRDPIKDGRNWYSYCESNPISFQDATGLSKLILPGSPNGLPPGWTQLPHGGGTAAERWLAPGGQEGLEFHPGQPGQKGEKGKSHWHKLKRGPNGKLKKEDEHLPPGKEIEVNTNPIVGPPEPVNIWRHIDWGEVRRRTEIVIIVVGIVVVTVSTAGTASSGALAGGGKLIARLASG